MELKENYYMQHIGLVRGVLAMVHPRHLLPIFMPGIAMLG